MRSTRRNWFGSLAAGAASQLALSAQVNSAGSRSRLSMPGPYRGRVVAVEHPRSILSDAYQAEPIRDMFLRGMTTLTGAPDSKAAWSALFQPGDVVGIKVNPVGQPRVISSPAALNEIINGLKVAGVKTGDIVVYDRYRAQFLKAGFDKWLPQGVRYSNATDDYNEVQQAIEGYDPDHYLDFPTTLPGQDISSKTARHSYAARFITKEVNKLVNLCVLKEHQSAGVTLALKNMSHGLVNNVNRSHPTTTQNVCGAFIPAVVSLPVIRNKAVLHVLDGIKGVWNGGPSARPQYVWEHKTMYFATDPVALDRIGWEEIDKKRVAMGRKKLLEDQPDPHSTYFHRQVEHIEIAGAMGLGEFDRAKIDLKQVKLGAVTFSV
jgi:uncharacterized protein (DUF362 family)